MRKHFLLLIALGFIWGTGFSIAKYVLGQGFSPSMYLLLNIIGPVLLVSITALKKINLFKTISKHFGFFAIITLTGILLPDLNKFIAIKYLPSGTIGVLTNTVPLFIYPMSLAIKEERFSWLRLLGILVGVTGILLVAYNNATAKNIFLQFNKFTLLALFTPFCYAICSIFIVKKRPTNCDSITLSAGMLILSLLILLPVTMFNHPLQLFDSRLHKLLPILLFGIVLSTTGYVLLFEVLRKLGSVCYSLTDGVVATTSLILGSLFLHEKLSGIAIIGIFCILTGLAALIKSQPPRSAEKIAAKDF